MSALVLSFDGEPIEFDVPGGAVVSVDRETRTIRGLAVPFGVEGIKGGKRWMFSKGTVRPYGPSIGSVKMWGIHDKALASGVAFELEETDEGLVAAFKVSRTPEGDKALTLAEDGVWDGLSIGPHETAKFQLRNGVYHAVDVPIHEISLTPAPVFGGARVRSVAFDADKENTMKCTKCGVVHLTGVTECDPAAVTAFDLANGTGPTVDSQGVETPTFDADAVVKAITDGFATLSAPQGREPVRAGAPLGFQVEEAPLYTFDGNDEHEFSTDLFAAMRGDHEAKTRVESFMADSIDPVNFAISVADVGGVNPSTHRPDLYVDRLVAATPLWNALRKGSLSDGTPFIFPKFVSAGDLVDDHTTMVEPDAATFVVTTQTVTPGALSGKAEIPREIVDAGGNPQVSRLVWREMERAYFAKLEAKLSAELAASAPTAIALTAGAVDEVLVNELEAALAALQFIDGGDRFDLGLAHVTLYKRLAAASDDVGRKLLPILSPSNANGSARSRFRSLDVAGYEFLPGTSLAGTEADGVRKSYLLASEDVHAWASPPRELRFEYQVAHVDIGIWGYAATAISRLDGIRVINYNRLGA
jgi:HK97 family phage prohead protease